MTSATYRQSSQARPELADRDPSNVLLARQNRLRARGGGRPRRDAGRQRAAEPDDRRAERPPAAAAGHLRADLRRAAPSGSRAQGADRYRRGLYTWFQRTSPYPMLMTFDAPDSNVCAVRRERSNTPLQALTLLNDPVFVECAQALGRADRRRSRAATASRAGSASRSGSAWPASRPTTSWPLARPAVRRPAKLVPEPSPRPRRSWSARIEPAGVDRRRGGRLGGPGADAAEPGRVRDAGVRPLGRHPREASHGIDLESHPPVAPRLPDHRRPAASACSRWRRCFREEGLLAAEATPADPLAPRPPHFAPKAKSCICIYLEGAPSQIDLFDPKPKLNELHGQTLPESMTKNVRFAFIQKETARAPGQPAQVRQARPVRHGAVRLLPHLAHLRRRHRLIRSMHTEAFNHHPGQLMMNTGVPTFGRPSMGSWLNYGLGSESKNLPGYVVLTAGRGTSGGTSQLVERLPADDLPGRAVPQPGRAGAEPDQPARPDRRDAATDRSRPSRDLNRQPARTRSATRRSTAASPPTSWPSACRRPPRS